MVLRKNTGTGAPASTVDAAPTARGTAYRERDVLLDHYRIEGQLGDGGMGRVYAVMNLTLQRREALKLMQPQHAQSPELVERFLREARAVASASLGSDHVVRVYACGRLPSGEPYMTLEYLSGTDLAAKLRRDGVLPVGEAVHHAREACLGLAEVHAQGLVHRDVKPSNLFLAERKRGAPQIKVLDFGIVKATDGKPGHTALTETGGFAPGTLPYMSPELLAADEADARADVWALGVVLYELITGRRPFPGANRVKLFSATKRAPDGVPGAPPALAAVILRCLAPSVAHRYATAAELYEALAPFDVPALEESTVVRAPGDAAVSPYATTEKADAGDPAEAPPVSPQTAPPVQTRARVPDRRASRVQSQAGFIALFGVIMLAGVATVGAPEGRRSPEVVQAPPLAPNPEPSHAPPPPPQQGPTTPTQPATSAPGSSSRPPPVAPIARPPRQPRPPGSAVAIDGGSPAPDAGHDAGAPVENDAGSDCDFDAKGRLVCK